MRKFSLVTGTSLTIFFAILNNPELTTALASRRPTIKNFTPINRAQQKNHCHSLANGQPRKFKSFDSSRSHQNGNRTRTERQGRQALQECLHFLREGELQEGRRGLH